MSRLLILFRPREAIGPTAKKAADKFNLMHGVTLQVVACKTIAEVGVHLGQKNVAIIFIESQLQLTDSNTFVGHYLGQRVRPYVVTDMDSYEALKRYIPPEKLGKTATLFSETFIFDCLRNLLAPTGKKIDIRYIQEIVKKLVEVIYKNTGFQMVPSRISEIKPTTNQVSIVSVTGFYGDGFLGSLTVTTSPTLMNSFAEKMLFVGAGDVTADMTLDLISELANQIEGAVRNGLQMFGYRPTSSMQVALVGERLQQIESTGGLNYDILFNLGDESLNANLSYNTYRTSIAEIGEVEKKTTRRSLDVRLLNFAIEATMAEIEARHQIIVHKQALTRQKTGSEKAWSFHIFHASDWQNKITLVLVFPDSASEAKAMTGVEPGAPDLDAMKQDSKGSNELISAVAANFMGLAKAKGYALQKIYQGQFSGSQFDFNLLNMGLFVRQELRSTEMNVDVVFGMDSSAVDPLFDAWPCFKDSKFIPQALAFKAVRA